MNLSISYFNFKLTIKKLYFSSDFQKFKSSFYSNFLLSRIMDDLHINSKRAVEQLVANPEVGYSDPVNTASRLINLRMKIKKLESMYEMAQTRLISVKLDAAIQDKQTTDEIEEMLKKIDKRLAELRRNVQKFEISIVDHC